jgi:hypothetical protein
MDIKLSETKVEELHIWVSLPKNGKAITGEVVRASDKNDINSADGKSTTRESDSTVEEDTGSDAVAMVEPSMTKNFQILEKKRSKGLTDIVRTTYYSFASINSRLDRLQKSARHIYECTGKQRSPAPGPEWKVLVVITAMEASHKPSFLGRR